MKKFTLFLLLAFVSVSVFSQDDDEKTFKFGLGPIFSLPVGDLKSSTSFGSGIDFMGDVSLSETLSAFLQAGVSVFKSKNTFDDNIFHAPFIGGVRLKSNGFFVSTGLGYGLWTDNGTSYNGFLYSPQVGYEIEHYLFLAHYTSTSVSGGRLSYFGIKLFRTF